MELICTNKQLMKKKVENIFPKRNQNHPTKDEHPISGINLYILKNI